MVNPESNEGREEQLEDVLSSAADEVLASAEAEESDSPPAVYNAKSHILSKVGGAAKFGAEFTFFLGTNVAINAVVNLTKYLIESVQKKGRMPVKRAFELGVDIFNFEEKKKEK